MPASFKQFVAQRTPDKSPQIRAFLKKIGNQYVDQTELCRAVGLATYDLARYRELFAAHLVPARTRAHSQTFLWAGTPRLAKQMRAVSGTREVSK